MRKIWLERANKRTNIERRKEKGTEQTHFRISCSVDGVAAFSCCSRNDDNDEERRERRGVEAMQRKRRDDEKEVDDERRKEGRRQNGISNWMVSILIPYSDAHSINIQLHRDHVSLSILLPFRILPRCTRTVWSCECVREKETDWSRRIRWREREREKDGKKIKERERKEGTGKRKEKRKRVRVPSRHCI